MRRGVKRTRRGGKENFVGGGGEILLWRGKRGRRLSGRAQTLGWLFLLLDMEGHFAPLPMQILLLDSHLGRRAFQDTYRNGSPARLFPWFHSTPSHFHGRGRFFFMVLALHYLLSPLRWILGLKCWASTRWSWHGGFYHSVLCRARPRGCTSCRLLICP
ncbi:hypothetical protein BDV10DRAFT_159897 [Aspergillus recurvatus]